MLNTKIYKPKEFAKLINRSVNTLQRWDRLGILKAYRSKTNRRYYTHEQYLEYIGQKASRDKKVIAYCRVSSSNQKQDLENQKKTIESYCINNGLILDEILTDIGSGLNYKRPNFLLLMEMVERGEVSKIIIAYKDRLVRFGFEWFERFCNNHGTEIIVTNCETLSPQQEMVEDLLSIIHCFSSRLYGLRKYKKEIKKMVTENAKNN